MSASNRIIKGGLAVFILVVPACLWLSAAHAALGKPPARKIGGAKQIFLDEDMVASLKNVSFTLNPAQRRERVLMATEPWEAAGPGYCKILKDGNRFQMWYLTWFYDQSIRGHWMSRICYAESNDGIHWEKKRLGQYEFEGSKDNNIIAVGFCGYAHGHDVFIDPNAASPNERYKMIFGDFYRVRPYKGCPQYTTVNGAVSPDGIHWKSIGTPHGLLIPSWGTDTQNVVFYDPNIRKYVAYSRYNHYRKDERGKKIQPSSRRIARTESRKFREFPPMHRAVCHQPRRHSPRPPFPHALRTGESQCAASWRTSRLHRIHGSRRYPRW